MTTGANERQGEGLQPTEAIDAAGQATVVEERPQAPDVVSAASPMPTPQDDDEDAEVQLALRNLEMRRAKKRRKRLIKIIVAVAVAVLVAGFFAMRAFKPADTSEDSALETVAVERGDFENLISGSGALKAGSSVVVTPEVDGIIESVSVTVGQAVNEGDVLFTLKNDSLDREVRAAEQEVKSAQQGLDAARRNVSSAEAARDEAWNKYYESWNQADAEHREWQYLHDNYNTLHAEWQQRMDYAMSLACGEPLYPGDAPTVDTSTPEGKAIYDAWEAAYTEYLAKLEQWESYQDAIELVGEEPQPAGTEPKYPDSPSDAQLQDAIRSAQDSVNTANNALTKANETYQDAVKKAEKRVVKAPASGNVVAIGAKVGESVGGATSSSSAAGSKTSSTPLVQISDVNKMSVDIEVNEIDILSVQKGQKATATFSAVPDVSVKATVSEVATVASGGTEGGGGGIVTYHVGLIINHPDPKLREGMTANVKISTISLKDVLTVPVSAVSEGAMGATVQVVVDEETMGTEVRQVKVVAKNSNTAVVEGDLNEGDLVVVGNVAEEEDV